MSAMGRKLLPMENPQRPMERFAWLVRTLRTYSDEPSVRSTQSFSSMLSSLSQESLQPETINKLENGKLNFTIERCLAYEKALGLAPYNLVDPYVWLCRENGTSPQSSTSPTSVGAHDIDLIVRVAQESRLDPVEWIRLARVYAHRRDLFASSRVRDCLFHGILRDYGATYERDQRLMREALITLGAEVVEYLSSYLNDAPMQYFNAIEVFGYIPHELSDSTLRLMQTMLDDRFVAPSILEAIARNMRLLGNQASIVNDRRYAQIHHFAIELLAEPNELYLPREAALGLLRQAPPISVDSHWKRQLSSVRDDLRQLAVDPVAHRPSEYLRATLERMQSALSKDRQCEEMPSHVPGLASVLNVGVFNEDRLSRLGAGGLLTAWQYSDMLIDSLAEVMRAVPREDYGTQRSFVRLITKIGGPRVGPQLRKLAWMPISDEGTRLSVAWALGVSNPAGAYSDERALHHLWDAATSRAERRVLVATARRRRFYELLEHMQNVGDGIVRTEALKATRSIT
jgi:hypothetical protein